MQEVPTDRKARARQNDPDGENDEQQSDEKQPHDGVGHLGGFRRFGAGRSASSRFSSALAR